MKIIEFLMRILEKCKKPHTGTTVYIIINRGPFFFIDFFSLFRHE